jgi:7-cyano-7-deazaguanine synthase
MSDRKKAVCICSGGLDSAVAASIAKKRGYELYFLHINYKHRAEKKEAEAAERLSSYLGAKELKFVNLDFLHDFGGSTLFEGQGHIPTGEEVVFSKGVPSTWVPCRNLVFLSVGASYAESIGADKIFVGFNAEEARSYPDNRREFVMRFNAVLRSFGKGIEVVAPLVDMFKAGIVRKGVEVDAPMELTWSCYFGDENHCGICEACQHRRRGFKETGIRDPTKYANAWT